MGQIPLFSVSHTITVVAGIVLNLNSDNRGNEKANKSKRKGVSVKHLLVVSLPWMLAEVRLKT